MPMCIFSPLSNTQTMKNHTIQVTMKTRGISMEYMLQHNPYTLMGQDEPEKLMQLADLISSRWGDASSTLFKLSFAKRQNLKSQGFTNLHFVNMLRWITTIDKETLNSNILGGPVLEHLGEYQRGETPQL